MSASASLNSLSIRLAVAPLTSGTRRPRSSLTPSFSASQPLSFPSLTLASKRPTPSYIPRAAATDDDEWGKEATSGGSDVAVAEPEEVVVVTEVDELKNKLKDLLYGTDRGLKASSETRAEIVELITQLEAKNPTPAPTEALSLLNGKWILAYTSFSQLFPVLGSRRLPQLVKVEEISQTIDSEAFTVQNSVSFAGPLATTSVKTNAKFEVRSPKRVQIKFEEGIVSTPQLTDSIEIPEKFEFLGQNIDLSPFKGIFTSIQDAASSVAKTISGQPPLKIPINNDNAQSWLLTTYLDEELRISRGDGGSIFVLIKEGKAQIATVVLLFWNESEPFVSASVAAFSLAFAKVPRRLFLSFDGSRVSLAIHRSEAKRPLSIDRRSKTKEVEIRDGDDVLLRLLALS